MKKSSANDGAGKLTTAELSRQKQREATKDVLVDTGTQVFAEFGFEGATVANIAKAAQVANGTFYLYFRDKEELYAEVVNRLLTRLAQHVSTVHGVFEQDAPDEGDRAEVELFVDFVEKHPGFVGAFWADGPNGRPLDLLTQQRESELRRMQDQGVVRADINVSVMARAETYLLFATLTWWEADQTVTRQEIIDALSEFRLHGTRPSDPRDFRHTA
jgi:AcrR family transcriptional regulator